MWQNFICKYLIIFLTKFFFRKFYRSNICHFGPATPNWWALKLGETAVLGMQLVIFLSAFSNNCCEFGVCSIAFVMYLLNVPLFNFVLVHNYCTPLSLDGFPNATTLLSLSFEFLIFACSRKNNICVFTYVHYLSPVLDYRVVLRKR